MRTHSLAQTSGAENADSKANNPQYSAAAYISTYVAFYFVLQHYFFIFSLKFPGALFTACALLSVFPYIPRRTLFVA